MRADCLYNLIGIGKDASIQEIDKRIERLEYLLKRKSTDESKEYMNKIKREYEKMCENRPLYDSQLEILSNNTDMLEEDDYLAAYKAINSGNSQYSNHADKSSYKDYDGFGGVTRSNDASKTKYEIHDKNNKRRKQAKKVKIKKTAKKFIAGMMVVVCAFGVSKGVSDYLKEKDANYNVCVEYKIKEGDTKTELENEYGIMDMCFSYMETTGAYRQLAAKEANVDIYDFLAAGDVIIGRTTEENAEKLVNEKGAEIITIEEALDVLEKSGLNSLVGEFKKASEGKSIIKFHIPTKEKVLG